MQTRQIPLEILKPALTEAIWRLRGAPGGAHAAGVTARTVLTGSMIAGRSNVGI